CEKPGVAGNMHHRTQHFGRKGVPVLYERLHQHTPPATIGTKRSRGDIDVSLEHNGSTISERLGKRGRRMNPFESVILQRKLREKRRACGQRKHSRAEIVRETREGQFHAAGRAARDLLGFESIHLESGLREDDRGCEPVGARSDNARFPVARHNSWMTDCTIRNFRIYSLGGTSGHSTTLISPSGAFSRVGAKRPISCRLHHIPVRRFSSMEVNQYCHNSVRIWRGGVCGNGLSANSCSTSSPFESRRITVLGTIWLSRHVPNEANHKFQSKRGW